MAPVPATQQAYAKDEKVLCFHGELLYEAKILDSKLSDSSDKKSPILYRVHYKGWKNTWDDWVNADRIRRLTDENKELAQNLKKDFDAQRKPAPVKASTTKKKAAGSDLGSNRGSEERHSSVPAIGRGQKRGRDYDLDKVGTDSFTSHRPMAFPGPSGRGTLAAPAVKEETGAAGRRGKVKSNVVAAVDGNPGPASNTPPSIEYGESATSPPLGPSRQLRSNNRSREHPADGPNGGGGRWEGLSTEEILQLPVPDDPPPTTRGSAMITTYPDYPNLTTAYSQSDIHPQIKKLNVDDPGNEAKRQLFRDQDHASVIMVAGIPTEPIPSWRRMDQAATSPSAVDSSLTADNSSSCSSSSSPSVAAANTKGVVVAFPNLLPSITLTAPEQAIIRKDLTREKEKKKKKKKRKERKLKADPKKRKAEAKQDEKQAVSNTSFQEENFHTRPAIRIPCPDQLKAILVDDWENVTKNLLLVQLPSKRPVNAVLGEYLEEEKQKRRRGSAEMEILEEVVVGLKDYFDKCLGRILLYRFEREQFFEMRGLWENAVGNEWEGKGPGDVYGAEHLARLIVTLPDLIAQTNMDHQSVSRLREELAKVTQWLAKHVGTCFVAGYEPAGQEYIERARGV